MDEFALKVWWAHALSLFFVCLNLKFLTSSSNPNKRERIGDLLPHLPAPGCDFGPCGNSLLQVGRQCEREECAGYIIKAVGTIFASVAKALIVNTTPVGLFTCDTVNAIADNPVGVGVPLAVITLIPKLPAPIALAVGAYAGIYAPIAHKYFCKETKK